jgi:hypothetical protein
MDRITARELLRSARAPLLWGSRLILQEPDGRLSVLNIEPGATRLEVLRNQPAPGMGFVPLRYGFRIVAFDTRYDVYPHEGLFFNSAAPDLPDVQIDQLYIRVGSQIFPNVGGYDGRPVIRVTPDGVGMGDFAPVAVSALVG